MAVKRKMSYAQLEPPKEKKMCLNMCSQYYKNKKAKTLTDYAEKNQYMEANEKQNLLAKKNKLLKTWVAVKKINCLKNKGLKQVKLSRQNL